MFFREPCREERRWPGIIPTSYGRCEVCEKAAPCHDIPSSYLPAPKEAPSDGNDRR